MTTLIQRFISDESGATMVEYAIMVALIAIVALLAVQTLGTKVNDTFTNVGNSLS